MRFQPAQDPLIHTIQPMSPMHQVGNSVAESRILSGPFTAPVAIKQLSQGFPIAAPDPRQLGI